MFYVFIAALIMSLVYLSQGSTYKLAYFHLDDQCETKFLSHLFTPPYFPSWNWVSYSGAIFSNGFCVAAQIPT
jgi:hypothetical protein